MYYDEDTSGVSFLSGLILGMLMGASLALLLAPQSGRRTRRRLVRTVEDVTDGTRDRLDDVTGDLRTAVKSSRKKLKL